ncbi:GNAT family N-acetyltransferase [Vallitalea guaymasensis]|uniref:Aminoglycoside N(6')-acetyltransferase type 1 n=1 Tax=Vallitalea guaymasensis TaxID=1185412 RepID=A0A8J8SBB0_9FIRM|nr:GNAT family N-acetyltransferase [Vallitalea guaymasensis]QUH28537.1 GNAT family N-acetyltransferase [Vallitalea guaymasensis]
MLKYRKIEESEIENKEYHRMRYSLWPHHTEKELLDEMELILKGKNFYRNELSWTVFVVVRENGMLGGFIEITIYPELDFCDSKPVGYIEGLYIDEDLRMQGIGRNLVKVAEKWIKSKNCKEIASDVELENIISQKVHIALRFNKSHIKDECIFYKKFLV